MLVDKLIMWTLGTFQVFRMQRWNLMVIYPFRDRSYHQVCHKMYITRSNSSEKTHSIAAFLMLVFVSSSYMSSVFKVGNNKHYSVLRDAGHWCVRTYFPVFCTEGASSAVWISITIFYAKCTFHLRHLPSQNSGLITSVYSNCLLASYVTCHTLIHRADRY
jgi:hypothetical protein